MRLMIAAMAFVLVGCVDEPAPKPEVVEDVMPKQTTCGAESLQSLVGQSAKVLETMRFGTTVRIIRPGMAVTKDFRPERLNINIDQANLIDRITCG